MLENITKHTEGAFMATVNFSFTHKISWQQKLVTGKLFPGPSAAGNWVCFFSSGPKSRERQIFFSQFSGRRSYAKLGRTRFPVHRGGGGQKPGGQIYIKPTKGAQKGRRPSTVGSGAIQCSGESGGELKGNRSPPERGGQAFSRCVGQEHCHTGTGPKWGGDTGNGGGGRHQTARQTCHNHSRGGQNRQRSFLPPLNDPPCKWPSFAQKKGGLDVNQSWRG